MVFDNIYLILPTMTKLQKHLKCLNMSVICQKAITSLVQINQILTKRSGKRKWDFIVKIHWSKMNTVASHFKSMKTVSISWQTNENKKEALCTLNIIFCRIPLTNKLNQGLQHLIQWKLYSRGYVYNNKWKKNLKINLLFWNHPLLFFISNKI